ncbi:MAG: UDP-N-acetyl-D-mannosamine dehydrogenase [Paracoccaceae bacterium]
MTRSLSVVGLGYVGLPTAVVFADAGLEVHGVDVNADTVSSINAGRPHIVEPNLEAMLGRVVEAGKLKASTEVAATDVYAIAVPTPFKDGNAPDLSYVEHAARMIAPHLGKGALVILESTSPVGATEQLSRWLADDRPDLSFPHQKGDLAEVQVAHCPERVLPGKVLHEVVHNDRIVGGMTRHCAARAEGFYKLAVQGTCHITDARTAELAKLTENAFRDVNIAFANELSLICHALAIDPWELIDMANKHPRVNILKPGPGVGGHCIAVDPWFIVDSAPEQARLIRTAREINDGKPAWVVERIAERAGEIGGNTPPVIACLGLAYKPDVDDLRESPSLEVVHQLLFRELGQVLVVEPYVNDLPDALKGADLADFRDALDRADIIVFLTAHSAFRNIRLSDLDGKRVVDSCGFLRQQVQVW